METKPDTIKITATQREEIAATYADLFVAIKGSSLVSGDSALKKAKEVSQFVDELTHYGLAAEAIHLQSIHAETSSGALLRSSSAIYRLRIRCEKLEQFADLMGIITSHTDPGGRSQGKNATFERVEWKYPDEAAKEEALEKAIQKADAKARRVAAALGVKLLGVYSFTQNIIDHEAFAPQGKFATPAAPRAMGIAMQSADLGMDIQHTKNIEVQADIEYRVSGFEGDHR